MNAEDNDETALARRARAELLAGARPGAVFATLAEDTHDFSAAALAVCTAAGISRAEAQQRWIEEVEVELGSEFQPEDGAELGLALELGGFFDVHRQLDEREQCIRHLLDLAVSESFATLGVLPSGHAVGVRRKVEAGRLAEAFVSMATFSVRRRHPMSAEYWTHLLAAADLLAISDDDQFESCVVACREKLAQRS